MIKNLLKITLVFPFIAIFTGAWTIELIDKPGSEHIVAGMAARDAEQYDAAVTHFQRAIDNAIDYRTQARAMVQIADIYLREDPVVSAKAVQAMNLLKKAEQLGSLRAKMVMGDMYREGKGVPADNQKAYEYYIQVEDRYANAMIALAEIIADPNISRDYIAKAAAKLEIEEVPSTQATIKLARHFRDGTVIRRDLELAEYWYGQAIEQESVSAMMELATLWDETGHKPRSDITSLWKMAALHQNHRAALEMGFAHALGDAVQRDGQLSGRYFQQAVELEPSNAYRIARWYEEREPLDPIFGDVAFNWFRVAAVKRHPDALVRQARAYWGGERVPEDRSRAERLYHIAAQAGSETAMAELAERQQRERDREIKLALKLEAQAAKRATQAAKRRMEIRKRTGGFDFWMPLAKSGDKEAMLRVGEAYMQGNGVAADTAKGLEWIRKSANKGFSEAMYVLAQTHSAGLGVPMNLEKAFEWYEKSANAGYVAGQYQLGLSYARGIGVAENNQKAREWLMKASKNGYSRATTILNSLTE